MRPPTLLLALLLMPVQLASAQVTIDLRALDELKATRSAAPRTPSAAQSRPSRPALGLPASASVANPPPSAPRGGPQNTGAPQPSASIAGASGAAAPDASLPTGVPPMPPAAMQASAAPSPGDAPPPIAVIASAVRLSFPAAKADLGADQTEVIKQLVHGAPLSETTTFNVVAYAAATPDDPSAARRLSLSRALAVRTLLMADGVPSSRIYVRALGSQGGDGPADRADVSVLGNNTPGSAPSRSSGQ